MKKHLISLIALLFVLILPFSAFAGANKSSTPLSLSTKTLDGKKLDSSIFQNYDLIFLNYWAEWCGPCVGEMPDLQKIHKNYKNVLVIGVYVSEDNAAAIATAKKYGVTYPLISVHDNSQLYDYITTDRGSFSIPQTCFFNNQGKQLSDAYIGSRNYDSWVALVEEALSGLTPEPRPEPKPEPEPEPEPESETVTVKGLKYTLDSTNLTASVNGSEDKTATKISIPASVSCNGKKYQVISIKANAFKKYTSLKSLTIGKNVKEIGKNAFNGCSALTKITIKTAKLTAGTVGNKAFRSINRKAVVKCPSSKLKEYKEILLKKGMPKTVTFK